MLLRLLKALALVSLLVVGHVMGCGGEDSGHHPPPPGDGDADADADSDGDSDADGDADGDGCLADFDEDGYGPLCNAGEDCNDNDPEVHDDCSVCREGVPQPNCPCFGTEDPIECHSHELYDNGHGRLECRLGVEACVDDGAGGFVWTACLDEQGNPVDG